jgi:MbtH protein
MSACRDEAEGRGRVLVNDEGQYSLWPENKPVPTGWRSCIVGSRLECLAYVEQLWTDMRPLSLRRTDTP